MREGLVRPVPRALVMLPTHHDPNVVVDQLGRRLVAAEEVRHNLALGNHQDLVGTGDGVLVIDGERRSRAAKLEFEDIIAGCFPHVLELQMASPELLLESE